VDLSSGSGDTLECKLIGDGLQSVPKLVLKSAIDSTDTTSAEGIVNANGDPKNATVTFKKSDLRDLTSSVYDVFFPDKNGLLQSTSLSIKLKPENSASIDSIDPSSIDLAKLDINVSFQLHGHRLNLLDKFVVICGKVSTPGSSISDVDDAGHNATAAVAPADLKKLPVGTCQTGFTLKGQKGTQPITKGALKLEITNTAAPTPAKSSAKPNAARKNQKKPPSH